MPRSTRTRSDIPPSCLRVLFHVMRLADDSKPITVRLLSEKLGWRSLHYTRKCLLNLRDRGLIHFDDKKAATIRPLYRFLPTENLSENIPEKQKVVLDKSPFGY